MAFHGEHNFGEDDCKCDCTRNLPRSIKLEIDSNFHAKAVLLDQTKLPFVEKFIHCTQYAQVIDAIKKLVVRGAPAIGISGAMATVVWALNESTQDSLGEFIYAFDFIADEIACARPTAVALSWAIEQVKELVHLHEKDCEKKDCEKKDGVEKDAACYLKSLKEKMIELVQTLITDEERVNRQIGKNGAELLKPGSRIMTHCNAGSIATAFFGTALGIAFEGFNRGLVKRVYACETRPVNQGGRLTTWELSKAGIPVTLICDDMSASVMCKGMVDAVIVGADRVAANGDTANKIGTCAHAIIAKQYGVPFYVAVSTPSIDMSYACGKDIVIEERDDKEVLGCSYNGFVCASDEQALAFRELIDSGFGRIETLGGGHIEFFNSGNSDNGGMDFEYTSWLRNTPEEIDVYNPAFDVTPAKLIDAIITEKGVFTRGEDGAFHFDL